MVKEIIIKSLDMTYLNDAVEMAQEAYEKERMVVGTLPELDQRAFYLEQLTALFEQGIGSMAFEGEECVGFLAFSPIYEWDESRKGTELPLYGYGVRHKKREQVIGKLFQSAAEKLCENYAQMLRANIYAHDKDILTMFLMSGFALDTTSVIRDTANEIISEKKINEQYCFKELTKAQILEYRDDLIELYRALINHLRFSPVFYDCSCFMPIEERYEDFLDDSMRLFAVFDKEQLIGMVDCEPTDLTYLKADTKAMGMGDVFIKPAYRGQGLGPSLLEFANRVMKEDGVERLLVTHGTINPTARGYWDRYFKRFTYSCERRIDPAMLGHLMPI